MSLLSILIACPNVSIGYGANDWSQPMNQPDHTCKHCTPRKGQCALWRNTKCNKNNHNCKYQPKV